MFYKQFLSEDLQAYSYMVGDEGKVVIIDPTYDVAQYLETMAQEGMSLLAVLETHRHEDQVSGARFLAEYTGAPVYHSAYEDLGYSFGSPLTEDHVFSPSESLTIRPLHTPGHTLGHLSYVVEIDGLPLMVMTGDTLFYGSVGRTDFYGEENLEDMTRKLHHSIYEKLMPLGEDVLVMPGHAAGSACGNDLDKIPVSSLGFERKHNSALAEDIESFLEKNAKMRYKNPAFSIMEVKNVTGDGALHAPSGLVCSDLSTAQIIDTRSISAYTAAHLPGSTYIPADKIATYLGWFYDPQKPTYFVVDDLGEKQIAHVMDILPRIGFVPGGVMKKGIITEQAASGKPLASIPLVLAEDYLRLAQEEGDFYTLDVRRREEFLETDPIHNRINIPYQEIKDRLDEIPRDRVCYVLCGSGERATVTSSWLLTQDLGVELRVIYGGIKGLRALTD